MRKLKSLRSCIVAAIISSNLFVLKDSFFSGGKAYELNFKDFAKEFPKRIIEYLSNLE